MPTCVRDLIAWYDGEFIEFRAGRDWVADDHEVLDEYGDYFEPRNKRPFIPSLTEPPQNRGGGK